MTKQNVFNYSFRNQFGILFLGVVVSRHYIEIYDSNTLSQTVYVIIRTQKFKCFIVQISAMHITPPNSNYTVHSILDPFELSISLKLTLDNYLDG